MKTLTLEFPDNIDFDDKDIRMIVAIHLFERGKLSLGQAAKLANYSKRVFMELLNDYNVSVINYSPIELEQDLEKAKNYNQ